LRVKSRFYWVHLSNIIHKNSSIRVSHGDFSARLSPSDPVESRVTLHCDAGGRNLKQQDHKRPIRRVETWSAATMLIPLVEFSSVIKSG